MEQILGTDVREDTLGTGKTQQLHKGSRSVTSAMTEKQGKCQRGPETDHRSGDQAATQTEEEITNRLGARDVGALATLRSFARPVRKDDDGGTPGPSHTLSRNHSGRVTLMREQWEHLGSNHHENRATGKEGKADRRRHKHSLWERRNGGTVVYLKM
jgi:hypothetical protein